ncbi:MAG: sporulation protein YtfJ [Ruminococcaceae bacterium]|nr:sporulation protein YtfJ [Oscillospiraceae bacterium]
MKGRNTMENESSIKNLITESLQQIRTFIDADTIVGKQIVTPGGTVIIPISKLSMGFASGGLDIPSKKSDAKSFGGGGGTGVTVSPIGFLIVSPEGKVSMMPLTPSKSGPVEQVFDLLDQAPGLIQRIVGAFGSSKDAAEEEEELAKREADIATQLAEELESLEPKSKKDIKAAMKEAKRAAKAEKKAARDN